MSDHVPPLRCRLCNASLRIIPAGFHQVYRLKGEIPLLLDWWECRACKGWFVDPVPVPELIERHWGVAKYNDPTRELAFADTKNYLNRKILSELAALTHPGPLLDFGCNFGHFLLLAFESGWRPTIGFEPSRVASDIARKKGFEVRCQWSFEEAGFAERYFSAITVVDVLSYLEDPFTTLRTFYRLLAPGGVLAMRVTNKRFALGLVRAFTIAGRSRDARVSRILLDHFHSIFLSELKRVLQKIGFEGVEIHPRATTAPWESLRWRTRSAYIGSELIRVMSFGNVNLSPGVLLFARKAIS